MARSAAIAILYLLFNLGLFCAQIFIAKCSLTILILYFVCAITIKLILLKCILYILKLGSTIQWKYTLKSSVNYYHLPLVLKRKMFHAGFFLRSGCYSKMLVEFINVLFCVRHHYKIHIIEVYVVHFEIRFYHVMVINRKIQCKLSSTIGIKE